MSLKMATVTFIDVLVIFCPWFILTTAKFLLAVWTVVASIADKIGRDTI